MAGQVPPPPVPTGRDVLKWTLPAGWTESRPGGMRFATLKPTPDGKLEVSVVTLGGRAGGELSNVNRWRGQLGLSPVDEAGLAGTRQLLKSKAGEMALFDFTSDDAQKTRMVVGVLFTDSAEWFIKLQGPAELTGKAKPELLQLLESCRFED
jgi:hypothetical protein